MADYIEFKLNGRKCRLNREDSYDLQIWCDRNGTRMYKEPYWRQVAIQKGNGGYNNCRVGNMRYGHHRIVYLAHNPEWDIHTDPRGNMIDHIDHDKTNNHISNLRVVTNSMNQQNRSSKYVKGYSLFPDGKYNARIRVNLKLINLGFFDTEDEARQAYLDAKKEYHVCGNES